MFNPGTLQHALKQDGIPALVQIGTWCSSKPAPGSALNAVLSVQFQDGRPVSGVNLISIDSYTCVSWPPSSPQSATRS